MKVKQTAPSLLDSRGIKSDDKKKTHPFTVKIHIIEREHTTG